MGKKRQEEPLEKLIQGRCTTEEYEAFVKKTEMEGLKVSQAIRALVVRYVGSAQSLNTPDAKILAIEKKLKELEERQEQTEAAISNKLGELAA
ncbi:MAG: hypothetical protein AAF915_13950 [Cyanobacteria bacterium P01_D01_bin.50]